MLHTLSCEAPAKVTVTLTGISAKRLNALIVWRRAPIYAGNYRRVLDEIINNGWVGSPEELAVRKAIFEAHQEAGAKP